MTRKKQTQSRKLHRYAKPAAWTLAGITLLIAGVLIYHQPSAAADVVVYKSPTCGCCKEWVQHLKKNGFSVEVHNRRDMNPVKAEMGIPSGLQSCHTAKVGGYVIEGHVPADVIARMLEEKPKIKGLAVPGMPMGSPGMEGPRKDAYEVLAFEPNGRTKVYAKR